MKHLQYERTSKTLCYAKKNNTQKLKYYKILSVRNIHSRQIHRDRQAVGCGSGSGQDRIVEKLVNG